MKKRTLCAALLVLFIVASNVYIMARQHERIMIARENAEKMRESDIFSIIDMIERGMPLTVEFVISLGFEIGLVDGDSDYITYYFHDVILFNGSKLTDISMVCVDGEKKIMEEQGFRWILNIMK